MTGRVPELSLAAHTYGSPKDRAAFSRDLMRGLQAYGFIVLTDHGVPQRVLDDAYRLAEELFALPEATKRASAGGLRGYTPFGTEHAKGVATPDLKEFWQIGREDAKTPGDGTFPANVWPEQPAGFRATFRALYDALDAAGLTLLEALAPELGLPKNHFNAMVRSGNSILRLLHYPPIAGDVEPGAVRAAAHEDINFITLLVAAKGAGLELLDRDGTWLPVETDPKNLIVDSGDMLARLTNDVIPATTHRVVNPAGPNVSRYSMPFFMHPRDDVTLSCLPSCVGDGAKYPEITAGAFLAERLRDIGLAT